MSWRGFRRRRQWDEVRFEEMETHIAHEVEENMGRGMREHDARRQAYVKFGNPQKLREEIWRMNSIGWLESLWRDVRYAGRALARNPGYALLAVLTLGLGVGANTAIFTVIEAVFLRPLPYAQGDRIVHFDQTVAQQGSEPVGISPPEFNDYRSESQSFSQMAEYHSMTFTLLGTKNPERVATGVVSANYFDVLGVKPALGRSFVASDERKDAAPVLLLSHAFWMKEFSGDASIVGRVFKMNDRAHTVIGVLPPLPEYPDANDVYMPVSSCPFRSSPMTEHDREARMVSGYARLKPGVTLEQARTELSAISGRMAAAWPQSYSKLTGFTAVTTPVREELTHAAQPTFFALLGASGLVLLLACANLANLALSRQLRRSREVAIRMATGASIWRIVRQLMTESVLVALAGAGIGIAIAAVGSKLLVTYAARLTPLADGIHIDIWVLLFGVGSALLSALLFAVVPAFMARRTRLTSLSEGGERSAGSAGGTRIRTALVTLQVALSFVLLMCAGLMLRSLYKLLSVDPGFRSAQVLSMELTLNWTRYKLDVNTANFFHQVLDRTEAMPGVEGASVSMMAPLNPDMPTFNGPVEIDGQPHSPGTAAPIVDYEMASPDYFNVLGVPVISGRTFNEGDSAKAPKVIVVNARMARHFWPNQNPIGHRVKPGNDKDWWTVVGVVGDMHRYGLDKEPADTLYVTLDQNPMNNVHLLVRTRNNPLSLANQITETIHQIDPEQPVTQIRTLDEMRNMQVGTPRVTATLLGLFAAVALFITVVGISGTLALAVAQRAKEIGLRIALGATKQNILREVLRRGMTPVLVGIGLGVGVSIFANRAMTQMIFGLKPDDPITFAGIAALFVLVALASCVIPARRAMGIDPVASLRAE